jgi:hypothetical protein
MRLPARPALCRLPVLALCASLAALSACDSRGVRITTTSTDEDSKGVLKVIDALQCPDSMGVLTRKGSAQADGTVCVYTGPRGAEVSLTLVRLGDQSVETVLSRFERLLVADMPQSVARMDEARQNADQARVEADAARAEADGARVEADAARQVADTASVSGPGVNIEAQGDRARVSLPGIHVDADGDKANVRIGGFTIRANEGGNSNSNTNTRSSNVSVRGDLTSDSQEAVSINANDAGAQIRRRAPGDATRQTFMLTDNHPSDAGWRLVGYEARGPQGGPIVVATVRARERHSDRVFDDARDLVALNVGD